MVFCVKGNPQIAIFMPAISALKIRKGWGLMCMYELSVMTQDIGIRREAFNVF